MITETRPDELDLARRVMQEVVGLVDRDGVHKEGYVPLGLINAKDVPVNFENLEIITRQLEDEAMLKGTDGQTQPILLGLVKGHDLLDVIDGFHRFTTFQMQERETIYATIIEVKMEELLDKRIQNTNNHSGLQFARASQWVREAWSLNPYSSRIGATSAFTLGRTKSSNGSYLGLAPEDVAAIMAWIDMKSALWGVEPMTIYNYLKTDEVVARDLVHNSRPDAKQASVGNSLRQSTLKIIGQQIPGRSDVQRAVASVITANKLSGTGITGILSDIKKMSDDEAVAYLATVDYTAYKEKIAEKQVFKYPEDDILRLDRVRDSSRVKPLAEIAALTTIHVDMVLNEGGYDPAKMLIVSSELQKIAAQLLDSVAQIDKVVSNIDATDTIEQKVAARTIEDFAQTLTEFLRDPSVKLDISTDREARYAERAVARRRGTQESLVKLSKAVRAYDKKQRERNG